MEISIEDLLNGRFLDLTQEYRMLIVLKGKPKPMFQISTVTGVNVQGEIKNEKCNLEIYDQVYWLTGGEYCQHFYCWPCVLFRETGIHWTVSFMKFTEQEYFFDLITWHERTSNHAEAELKFRTFLQLFSSKHLNGMKENLNHSEFYAVFCRNREILKLLIQAVCIVIAEGKPFRRNISTPSQISRSSCTNAIIELKFRDYTKFKYCKDAIKLIEMRPTLLDDLVESMTEAMIHAVKAEVEMSTYVSLILSGHYSSPTKHQLSKVLRFTCKGKVCERFLGFINITGNGFVFTICDIIKRIIEEFQISEKLLSYSFDGSVLELSELRDLNTLLQSKYPQSYFVPCYFHDVLHTFQQSLTVNKDLALFFEILCVMEYYFKEDAERRTFLESLIVLNRTNKNKDLSLKDPFIKIVLLCRMHLVESLKYMANNTNTWSADDYNKVGNFIQFLENFKMVYFLHTLSPLCEHIMLLDAALRMFSPEMEFRSVIIPRIKLNFRNEKDKFFEYFSNAIEEMGYENDYDSALTYLSEYIAIIDHLEKELALRFSNLDDLSFCSLIHSAMVFPESFSQLYLNTVSLKLANIPQLNFTLQRLYDEIKHHKNIILESKNEYDLLYFFEYADSNVSSSKNLLEFTLTIPFKPPKEDGDSSILQKLNKLAYSTCTETSGDASVLHVESKFLHDLQSDAFNCRVLLNFYKLTKCIEF